MAVEMARLAARHRRPDGPSDRRYGQRTDRTRGTRCAVAPRSSPSPSPSALAGRAAPTTRRRTRPRRSASPRRRPWRRSRCTILVTNDDGIGAPGHRCAGRRPRRSSTTSRSRSWPRLENQSGSSDTTTPGGATYARRRPPRAGSRARRSTAIPADTIAVALDDLGLEPDLVVSGVNQGQNTGPLAYESGTVGAGRARPSAAASPPSRAAPGCSDDADYAAAVDADRRPASTEHRAEFADGSAADGRSSQLQRARLHRGQRPGARSRSRWRRRSPTG